MDHPFHPRPTLPLDEGSPRTRRPTGHRPPRSSRLAWLALATSLLGSGIAPGCLAHGGDPGGESEDVAEVEEAITAATNIAQGKTATQSSTGYGGVASRAVDGNTDGDFGHASVTHTTFEASPWWKVDLGASEYVSTVELHNRTDCCAERLSNFKVLVSNDGSSWQAWSHPGVAGATASFDVRRTARYVKVQLEPTGVARALSLAEVKLYSAASGSLASSITGVPTLGATAPAGTLDGQLDVDAQGAATYSIPIKVPPGTNGVEPNLSLAYRSAGGNGLAGMGWGLSGISTITRCARNPAQDGAHGAVTGSASDRFCLDGKRLVVVNGTYGADGAEYRTELESFSRVLSYGTCGTGPCRFEVTDKGGDKATFGGTTDSRALLGSTVRAWGVSKLSSRHGNHLTVAYTTESGQLYPQQILYTMNDAAPWLKKRRVAFSYEGRTDTEIRYVAGHKVLAAGKRLTKVATYVEGAAGEVPVREYRLVYGSSPATKRSLLTSVKECDGQGVCLPATSLEYLSAAGSKFTIVEPSGPEYQDWLRHDPGANLLPGDYNGDGKTDFLRQERGGWGTDIVSNLMVYFSNGDGTFTIAPATCMVNGENRCQVLTGFEFGAVLHPADVDGDGLTDFYRQERGGWGATPGSDVEAYRSLGNGTFVPYGVSQTGLSFDGGGLADPGTYLILGDFTGDGATDFFGQARGVHAPWGEWISQWHLALAKWNGAGFSLSSPPVVVDGWDWFGATMAHDRGAYLFTGDFDGNGVTDLLRQEHGEWNTDANHNLHLYLAQGGGQFTQVVPHDYQAGGFDKLQHDFNYSPGAAIIPGDFNGDGLTDLIRQERGAWATADDAHTFRVYFSNGVGGFDVVEPVGGQYQTLLKGDDVQLTLLDYNGDGKTDFLRRGDLGAGYNFHVYVSRGDGTFDILVPTEPGTGGDWYQTLLRHGSSNVFAGDFDGDGKTDFLRQEKSSWDDDSTRTFQVFLADGDDAVDALKKVTNGLGGTVDVSYAPLTDGAVYTKGTGATGTLTDVQSPTFVVESYQTDDGAGSTSLHSYTYEGARFDRSGRGFLGFAKVTRTDDASSAATIVEYNQSPFPLTGTVKSRTVQSTVATAKVRTDYTYSTSTTYGGVHVVVPVREKVTHTEGPNSYATVKEYEYDAWGNLAILHDRGLDGDPSDDVDRCSAHSGGDGVAAWRLNYPTYTRVAASCTMVNGLCQCSGILSWVDHYYDWATMNLTTVYEYDDRNGAWPYVALTYDALGNVLTRSLPGISTRIVETNTYDPAYGTFPVAQTKTGGDLSFTTTSTFDPRFGALVAQTDVNGNITSSTLDGLGRMVEKLQTSPDGNLVPTVRVVWGTDAQGTYREARTRADWQSDDWAWQREYLDGGGRARRLVAQGEGATVLFTDRLFDATGQVAAETQPYHEPLAPVWQTYTRDWLGRIVETTDALETVTKIAYGIDTAACPRCAMKVTTTEAFDAETERTWTRNNDVFDRPRRQVDPDGRITMFDHDRLGRRTSVSDSVGATVTVYDSLDRVTSVTSPDRGTVTNTYGPGNWLSSTTDANQIVTTYTYDDVGRVEQKTAVGKETTIFSYDDPARANSLGRLTSVKVVPAGQQTPSSSNDFSYDPSGAIETNVVTIGAHTYTLASTYDPEGRLRTLTYPDGSVLEREHAASGALRKLKMGGTVHAEYDLFTDLGKAGKVIYGNDVESTFSYDAAGRMTATSTDGPGDVSLLDYHYTWDRLHRITKVTDGLVTPRTQTFTYTASGELSSAKSGAYGPLSYEYDDSGNMTWKEGKTYTYEDHRVVSAPGFTATYDDAGNRVTQEVDGVDYEFEYGPENRLKQVSREGVVVTEYQYDFSGERVQKVDRVVVGQTVQTTTTLYVTPAFEVTFFPGGRRLETKYLNGPSGRVAAVSTPFPASASAMLDFRGLDSTSRLFDTGSVAGLLAYAAARARALQSHPDAPLWGQIALALAIAAAGVALARRRAPARLATVLRALRAVALPEKTDFVRRHPVFAFAVPFVTAAFLSACTGVPGREATGDTRDALIAGDNGEGYPVPGTHYFHQDHIGSSSLVTDEDGHEVARAVYKPYGELVQAASPGEDIFRSKFAGKEWDKDAGLYYFNARYYDPLTGRFTSADTQVLGGAERNTTAVNPYAYANNSPVIYSDPSGRLFFLIVVVAIVVGAYAGGMNANGGSWNPGSWSWSSWQTYVGIGVGGLVGALSAGVGVGIGGFAGAMASTLMNSVALNGLKFLSPQGSSLEEYGIGIATDLAVGGLTAGASAAVASQVSKAATPLAKTFTERIAAKVAERVTVSAVATLLGKTALGVGAGASMRCASAHGLDRAVYGSLSGRSDAPSRSRPPEPPSSVDHSHVTQLVTSMSDALLAATGADDVFGRSTRDFTARDRRRALAPSFAMGF